MSDEQANVDYLYNLRDVVLTWTAHVGPTAAFGPVVATCLFHAAVCVYIADVFDPAAATC